MKIIITMAGEGRRFRDRGFKQPKYEINAKGKVIFDHSLISLKNFFDKKFIFVSLKKNNPEEFIEKRCMKLGIDDYEIVVLDKLTEGQADSALAARSHVDDADEILIYNIDTHADPGEITPGDIKGDGWVPSFRAEGSHFSFVRFDKNNKVYDIAEKRPISEFATLGLYYFSSFSLFKRLFREHYSGRDGEHYIAPLYSRLIKEDRPVYTKIIENTYCLGTPREVEEYEKK